MLGVIAFTMRTKIGTQNIINVATNLIRDLISFIYVYKHWNKKCLFTGYFQKSAEAIFEKSKGVKVLHHKTFSFLIRTLYINFRLSLYFTVYFFSVD